MVYIFLRYNCFSPLDWLTPSLLRLSGLYSDRPVYKHEEREEFMFYLTSRRRGLWMIGPAVGQFNGGLANRGDPVSTTICLQSSNPYPEPPPGVR